MGNIRIAKQLYRRIVLKGNRNRPKMRRIQHLITKYKYTGPTSFSTATEAQAFLHECIREFNNFKKSAHSHRWTQLEVLAREYDERDKKGLSHHFLILQHRREQVKDYYRTIRHCEMEDELTKYKLTRIATW